MLRGQPDTQPRWEHGRLGKQPGVQLSSKKTGTTLRLTVDYDDGQTAQHILEETCVEIEVLMNTAAQAAGARRLQQTKGVDQRCRVYRGAAGEYRESKAQACELANCPICLDCIRSPMITPCGHRFCNGCIKRALSYKKECPTCRRPIATHRTLRDDVDSPPGTSLQSYRTADGEGGACAHPERAVPGTAAPARWAAPTGGSGNGVHQASCRAAQGQPRESEVPGKRRHTIRSKRRRGAS